MKANGGVKVGPQLNSILTTALDRDKQLTSLPSRFPRKKKTFPTELGMSGPQRRPGSFEEEESLLLVPGFELRSINCGYFPFCKAKSPTAHQ